MDAAQRALACLISGPSASSRGGWGGWKLEKSIPECPQWGRGARWAEKWRSMSVRESEAKLLAQEAAAVLFPDRGRKSSSRKSGEQQL